MSKTQYFYPFFVSSVILPYFPLFRITFLLTEASNRVTMDSKEVESMREYKPMQFDFWPPICLENSLIGDAGIGVDESRDGRYVRSHSHGPLFELTYIVRGSGTSYAAGIPTKVKEGDIFLSVPYERHRLDSDAGAPLCQQFVSFGILSPKLTTLSDRLWKVSLPPTNRIFHDDGIPLLMDLILEELSGDLKSYRTEILSTLIDQITFRMLRAYADFSPKPLSAAPSDKELVEHITHYIDTHVYSLRSLSEIGDALTYNYSYLSSRYKQITGQKIKDYYNKRRMDEAKRLLGTRAYSISGVAEKLGYSGVYAFSKAFKAYYKMPPSELFKNK